MKLGNSMKKMSFTRGKIATKMISIAASVKMGLFLS